MVRQLNQHAVHLIPALYSVVKRLGGPEFEFIESRYAHKFIKGTFTKNPKAAAFFSEAQVQDWGHTLRALYTFACHAFLFRAKTLQMLQDLAEQGRDWDLTWNYIYAMPILRLFGNYVKLSLLIGEAKTLPLVVRLYNACLSYAGVSDPVIDEVAAFVSDGSMKRVEADLQPYFEPFTSFFKAILPAIQLALGTGATFRWKHLTLSDKPKAFLPSDIFFRPHFLVFAHMSDIMEWFLYYALLFM
jgi:hypothetical protein